MDDNRLRIGIVTIVEGGKEDQYKSEGYEVHSYANEKHVPKLARPMEEALAEAVATLSEKKQQISRGQKSMFDARALCRARS